MVHAAEFGDDRIRVNCLTPGWIMTQKQVDLWLTPQGEKDLEKGQLLKERLHEPDVARLALFLAADDSRLITAQNYLVDAGWA
jgi:NAD(P)-dependent dehydrogenase (short-subunit alcohol dehydrogenase family)